MDNFQPHTSRRDNRTRFVHYPAERGRMVKLEIHHRDGGMNYFSGSTEQRGIEISFSTIDVVPSGTSGVMMETSSPMSEANGRLLLVPTARYSAKKVEDLAALLDPLAPAIAAKWDEDRRAAVAMVQDAVAAATRRAA